MQINVTYDSSVANAPAGFTAAVSAAVAYYESLASPATINITIGWGTVDGQTIPAGAVGASDPAGYLVNYQQLRNALWADATTPAALTAALNLPASDPTNGGTYFVTSAEAKALGLVSPQDSATDGTIVIDPTTAYTFDPNNRAVSGDVDLIGVLEHEIGHILGRVSFLGEAIPGGGNLYGSLDLFRYSAPGVLAPSATDASFSINGQNLLLPFNDPSNGGDADDWSISNTGDSYDAFADTGVAEQISGTDQTMLDVFGFHPAQAAPSVTLPNIAPTASSSLADGAQIAQGQTVYLNDGGYRTQGSATNAGTVIFDDEYSYSDAAFDSSNLTQNSAVFTNTATGSIISVASQEIAVGAFFFAAAGPAIVNSGLIESVSTGGSAYGIVSFADPGVYSNPPGTAFLNTASGVLNIWAKYAATAADLINGGTFNNQGTVDIVGDTTPGSLSDPYAPEGGVIGVSGATSFNNSGTITVTAPGGDFPSIGVELYQNTPTSAFTNSGTIIADYAFYVDEGSLDPAFIPDVDIVNSGKIIGAIAFGQGDNQVHNTGIIAGNIYFGNSNAVYDGTSGHLYGDIYLGDATNTITLGNDGDTVYGGGGADTITGGAGDDTFMIARGNNHIDGGGGFNILSLQSAAGGYTVNLGAGTAVGAGTTTLANIQRVIGSDWGDTLIAGNSAADLISGSGNSILRGGTGNDTLVAGTGGDTMTGGGGNNSFIYSAGDQQLVITDFDANGDNDVLKIYGYAAPASVQQQGADTLITLSGSDSILLKNVNAASLGGGVIYTAADYQAPLTSTPQYVFASQPYDVESQYTQWFYLNYGLTVYANEHVDMDFGPAVTGQINYTPGHYGIIMDGDNAKRGVVTSLDNFGQISAFARDGGLDGLRVATNVYRGSFFNNEAGASFIVTNTNGSADGIYAPNSAPDLVNSGSFDVSASGALTQADGLYTYDSYFSFDNTATGIFSVTDSNSWAYGLELHNGGVFRNDGQYTVTGDGTLYGVYEDQFQLGDTVTNNGSVIVSGTAGSTTYGFSFRGDDYVQFAPISFVNTGTITAQTAIQSIFTRPGVSPADAPSLNIQNSGTINGNIELGGSRSIISNTGTINGNILIHDDDDGAAGYDYVNYGPGRTIDLRGGHFNGSIEIAPGVAGDVAIQDTIYTGTATTTVKIDGGQSNLAATITADPTVGKTTIQYDIASTAASLTKNSDGSWTVSAGTDGTETLFNVAALEFTDRTVSIAVPRPPVLTTAGVTLQHGQSVAVSSLFTVTDPAGNPITEYQLWDSVDDPSTGHFVVNGVVEQGRTVIDITAAQLAQTTYVAGAVGENLQIRAFDGVNWSAPAAGAWAPFTVSVPPNHPPVLTTANVTLQAGQSVAASSLFTVSDADGDPITEYQLWDSVDSDSTGHFVVNGVAQQGRTVIDITATQLAQTTYVAGAVGENLQIRAFDGYDWSAPAAGAWAPFTVSVPAAPQTPPPILTTAGVTLQHGQSVAVSSLFTVTDPAGNPITEYQLWDSVDDPSTGHFVVNGVVEQGRTVIDITAAQLAQTTYVAGAVGENLQIRAFDGANWSAPAAGAWAPFTVSVPPNHPPVLTTANVTLQAGQSVAASSLFTVSDADGDPITEYQLWDSVDSDSTGHFVVNGVAQQGRTVIDITATQLAQTTYVAGAVGENLQIRAFDGYDWSAPAAGAWAPFTVSVPAAPQTPPPILTTAGVTLQHGQSVAVSSLFTVTDPAGNPITEYQLWDSVDDPSTGHFVVNGVVEQGRTVIDITAAQLAQTTYVAGAVGENLQIRAFDGANWSAPAAGAWAPFHVSIS